MSEIADRDSLRAWLRDKPSAVAVAIATRASLRSAPLLVEPLDGNADERRVTRLLPSFHAIAFASFAGKWPKQR